MRLHSPDFERHLRRNVRQTIRGSPELRQAFRRANKYRRHVATAGVLRPLISLGLAVVVWNCSRQTGHPETGMALLAIWLSWLALFQSMRLQNLLYQSRDLAALFFLPITVPAIFRWQLQKFFRGAAWSVIDSVAVLLVLGGLLDFGRIQCVFALPLALLAWAVQVALALLLTARVPRLPPLAMMVGGASFIGIVLLDKLLAGGILPLVDRYATAMLTFLPTGWVLRVFELLDGKHSGWALLGLVPAGLVIWTVRRSLAHLQATYRFTEIPRPEVSDRVPDDFEATREMWRPGGPTGAGASNERVLRVGATDVEEHILSRTFLAPHKYAPAQWLERWFWRWLTPREQALADFSFPDGLKLTKPWLKVFRNLALAILLGLALPWVRPGAAHWIWIPWIGGLLVTGLRAWSLIYVGSAGFGHVFCSGVNVPLYAMHPVGYRELARLLWKCSLIQTPVAGLFAISGSLVINSLAGGALNTGLLCGLKAALLLPAVRFLILPTSFGVGMINTADVRFKQVVTTVPLFLGGLGFIGLGVTSMVVSSHVVAALAIAGAGGIAYGTFRHYAWLFNRARSDLMALPGAPTQ